MVKQRSHKYSIPYCRRKSRRCKRRNSRRFTRRKQTGRGFLKKVGYFQKSRFAALPDDLKRKIFKTIPKDLIIPNNQMDSFENSDWVNMDTQSSSALYKNLLHADAKYGYHAVHVPRTSAQVDEELPYDKAMYAF